MMDQRSRSGDVTNTNTISNLLCKVTPVYSSANMCIHQCYIPAVLGVPSGEGPNREDSKERRRRKDKERYEAMSHEKKDELNSRRRERRKQKKEHACDFDNCVK